MSYQYQNISVSKISIIGAGQIGPDIALYFSKVFVRHNVKIIIVDIAEIAIQNAKTKIEKKINRGVETGAFKPEMADNMKTSIDYTLNYKDIAGSDIVLEAATEDEKIKDAIFKQIEIYCNNECLFFSNSSHMQPEVIFKNINNQKRCLVTHYFFPAERNPVVEIIPSDKTDKNLVQDLLGLYESIGKVPIKVKSSYGYAIDPIFEGLCQTAILCLERGYGTVKEIDKVATEDLGLGVGPFTALNLTGGNPITDHGLNEMNKQLMPWFKSPARLAEAVKNNQSWPTAARGEEVDVPADKREKITRQFQGAYFGLASYIMDLGICSLSDLNMACELSLVIKPPFSMMNKIGLENSLSVVREFCGDHNGFKVPRSLEKAAQVGSWKISNIVRSIKNNVAILTIRRPRVLNALNSTIMNELMDHFTDIENNPSIIGTVLTGFGIKAFVSGADIKQLAACKTPEDGYKISGKFHEVLNYIENLKKPVVCALNGFAFGGGNELAMACTTRICRKNMPVLACQPEVNLGFIAGAGGTQRLPRLVGLDIAAEILRTGRPVSSVEAVEIGLVYKEVEGNLVDAAVSLVKEINQGGVDLKPITKSPLEYDKIPQVNIGHLSKKIDEILVKAIYEGAKLNLEEGLELEAPLFGKCIKTEDMKIGINNFLKNGPKVKAEFVNR